LFSRPWGGVWLTLATIAAVGLISRALFRVPQPTSIYLVAVAAATAMGGTRVGLVSALFVILASIASLSHGGLFQFAPEDTVRLAIYCVTAPTLAVIAGVLRKRNDRLVRERAVRDQARRDAEAALVRERRIAATLQGALLSAPAEDAFPGIRVATRYEAASDEAEIGGDFFDVFAVDDRRVALLVGDVSGKGLAAASRTAEVKYTVRALLREYGSAAEAICRANRALVREEDELATTAGVPTVPGGPAPLVPACFSCLSLAVIDAKAGAASIVVAGMEPPVVVRASSGHAETLQNDGMPLGLSDQASYQALDVSLGAGDLLVFATDGITEARDASGLRFFGTDGLSAAAVRVHASGSVHPQRPLADVAQALLDAACAFTPHGRLKDDACVLVAMMG
jgi:sigma-B regulation protein RsbU (phosphoserine phosphatase)